MSTARPTSGQPQFVLWNLPALKGIAHSSSVFVVGCDLRGTNENVVEPIAIKVAVGGNGTPAPI